MNAIQSEQPSVPVEAEPRYVSETASLPAGENESGRRFPRILTIIFSTIVLVLAIVFLARWVYHASHNTIQPTAAVSKKAPVSSPNNSVSGAQPQSASGSSSASRPSSGSSSSSSSANSSSPKSSSSSDSGSNQQIVNTGPGNVVAIFVTTSLAAAGLYYIISLRRFSKSQN